MCRFPCLVALLCATTVLYAEPLRFDEALTRAEQRAPALTAADAGIAAATAARVAAGRLPDPSLFVGLDNLPVSGTDAWSPTRDSMTMHKFGVVQQFPNGAKRAAARAARTADVALAGAERHERRTALRSATAVAWIEGYHLRRQHALLDALEAENRTLTATVQAALAAGEGRVADSYVPVREAVELADRRDDLARDEARVLAGLTRYVGLTSLAELAGEPPEFRIDPASLREHLVHHAELARYVAELDQADAALREAVAARRPDWGMELAFQHRGPAFGDMVSLQFSLDLPVSPATRQDPLIEARRHDVDRLLAERADMLRNHENTLATLLGRHASLGRQLARAQQTLLPALQRQVELLEAGYRAGSADLRELLDARRELLAARLRIIDLESRSEVIAARLHFAYEETQS